MTSPSTEWQSLMSGSSHPVLSKAVSASLCKSIVENVPPLTGTLEVRGHLSISLGTCEKPIALTINERIEPSAAGAWSDSGSERNSPLFIPIDKIKDAQQRFLNCNGEVTSRSDSPASLNGVETASTHSDVKSDAPVDLSPRPEEQKIGRAHV